MVWGVLMKWITRAAGFLALYSLVRGSVTMDDGFIFYLDIFMVSICVLSEVQWARENKK